MRDDIEKILLNEESLSGIVKELGAKISEDYRGKRLLMISILKGSVVFMADACNHHSLPHRFYGGFQLWFRRENERRRQNRKRFGY